MQHISYPFSLGSKDDLITYIQGSSPHVKDVTVAEYPNDELIVHVKLGFWYCFFFGETYRKWLAPILKQHLPLRVADRTELIIL